MKQPVCMPSLSSRLRVKAHLDRRPLSEEGLLTQIRSPRMICKVKFWT